ncbi:MAG: ABC transporter ATP-binding protein [Candidatus Shapirobacteria bacterium]|jgi:ATP-binding cassette subfamily B protein
MVKIFKRFYQFNLKYKYAFAAFLAALIVSGVLENLGPYGMKLFIDNATSGTYDKLAGILLFYVTLKLISGLADALANYLGDWVVIPAARDARVQIFKYVQDLDFAFHVNKNTGSLISAFKRGDGAFFNLFGNLHSEVFKTVVSLVVVLFFFGRINTDILTMMIGLFVINCLIMGALIRLNMKKRTAFNESEDEISGIITDNLLNYETVKFFNQEKMEEKRLKYKFLSWTKNIWGFSNSFRIMDVSLGTVSSLGMLLMLSRATQMLVAGQITIGDLVMISSFLSGFYYRFFGLFFQLRNITKSFIDLEKYFAILDQKIIVADPLKPKTIKNIKGQIEFKEVTFAYPGNRSQVVENIDLRIEPGDSVAFVGRSGAGKTTIVKLLLRFYDLKKGKILVDGVDIKSMNKGYLRSIMAVVPQEPVLFNNSIKFNLGYGKEEATMEEIKAAAKMANLDDFIESLPDGYETHVGERGIKLSGGQKQRLAIARAMLCDPKILIFDEATSNLDSESEKLIQDALWRTAKGRTLLIIAHRFSTIRRADKIVVLEHGKIVEMGKHIELINIVGGVYRKLWMLQAKGKLEKDLGSLTTKG